MSLYLLFDHIFMNELSMQRSARRLPELLSGGEGVGGRCTLTEWMKVSKFYCRHVWFAAETVTYSESALAWPVVQMGLTV